MNTRRFLTVVVCLGLFTVLGGSIRADAYARSLPSAATGTGLVLSDVPGPASAWPAAQWLAVASLPPLQNIAAIAAGASHTCALTTGGGVKCWGNNASGQLGDGTTTGRSTPVDVVWLSNGVAAIAAGESHTCALTAGGGVKCWGSNGFGQLGDGTTTNRTTPVDVFGLGSGVTAIAAGYYHTCALTTGGGVKCWGYNENG